MEKTVENISKWLILIILFFGCKSVKIEKKKIVGEYQYRGIYGVGSNITIRKDNTFTYEWQTGLIGGTTNGHWELRGNKLILNSDKQPKKEKDFIIIERDRTDNSQFEIKVIDEKDKSELIGAYCMLVSDTTLIKGKTADINGNCNLSFDGKANKLQISFTGYRLVDIQTKNLYSNSVIVEMKEELDYYEYFTNREWSVKRQRIYDPEKKKSKYVKKNYYEKIKK